MPPLSDPRANPLASGPLVTRDDLARAVADCYEPLIPHISPGGARVRLGSFAAGFPAQVAELEGFSRPLYGIVPLTVGGGSFAHWDRVLAGLEAGTDPHSSEYWGPVAGDGDQRMVEQAAIGLALAFCPEHAWEPLPAAAKQHLVTWLAGIFDHEPSPNNWQFFRVLVALGLERVGGPVDHAAVAASLDRIESYRRGRYSYVDGVLGTVDWYLPMALHTYGLYYAAAARLGLGDADRAEAFRERAAGNASDLAWWFGPDGAAIPLGRSLTYRFALCSFWSALAWADVEPAGLTWGQVRGMVLRHLRWWAEPAISDRDGVLSVGHTYDNRRLAETYNSPGSPYWAMKAFGALAAGPDHPFWTSDEQPLPAEHGPATLTDLGWVATRDTEQASTLVAQPAMDLAFPEQAAAKYRKFAYSSALAFAGDLPDVIGGIHTDSMLALTDAEGNRRVRLGIASAGVGDGLAWSTWWPFADVRVDTVCWAVDGAWHGRRHRIRTRRFLASEETGFGIGHTPTGAGTEGAGGTHGPDRAAVTTEHGTSAIVGITGGRQGATQPLAVNAHLYWPHAVVPALRVGLAPGDHDLACVVFASPGATGVPDEVPTEPPAVAERLAEIAAAGETPGDDHAAGDDREDREPT